MTTLVTSIKYLHFNQQLKEDNLYSQTNYKTKFYNDLVYVANFTKRMDRTNLNSSNAI